MTDTRKYFLEDLHAHNRKIAERFPEVWSKFRWYMRGCVYGNEQLNDAFTMYHRGWYDHILHERKHAPQS
jgi:hypothetical protein